MKMFPIMTSQKDIDAIRQTHALALVVQVPWPMIEAHEKQALTNHSQTVKRLAERGGLSACEAVAVLEGRPWSSITLDRAAAHNRLKDLFNEWWAAANPPAAVGNG